MKRVYGIDMEQTQHSKPLSELPPVDVVVTMGCGVQCPALPCAHQQDGPEYPTGRGEEAFLSIMKQIEEKVRGSETARAERPTGVTLRGGSTMFFRKSRKIPI